MKEEWIRKNGRMGEKGRKKKEEWKKYERRMFGAGGRGKNWGGRERFYLFEKAWSPNCLGYTFLRSSWNLNILVFEVVAFLQWYR